MRNLIVSMNVTADGFMAGPDGELDWHFKFWDSEMCEYICEQMYSADALLLGRKTYNALAAYWPQKELELGMPRADIILYNIMNRYQKIVCSRTLKQLPWRNSFLLSGNLRDDILSLKQTKGKNIITYGSGQLVTALTAHDLVDRYELWVHPVKIKSGISLFQRPNMPTAMKISENRNLRSGVNIIHYDRLEFQDGI